MHVGGRSRMRVGIDAGPLKHARSGGIRRYTESLIRALGRQSPNNDYVLFRAPDAARLDSLQELGDNFAWDQLEFPLKRWMDYFHLFGASDKIDFYHGTNYSAPLLAQQPSVLTVHDLTVQLFPEVHPRHRRLAHSMLPLLCRKARRLIADSFNTKEDLIRHFGVDEDRIDVVHLAVSEEFQPIEDAVERERVRTRYGLPESFLLFVGSIEPRKNLPWLMRSVKELRDEGFPHKLVVAGQGEPGFVEELRQTALSLGLSLGDDVVLTGFVEEADLPALYSCSELFVFPSIYEGFGLPPLEAMACGVPVLLPENSSFTEYYRDCSLMVDLSEPAVLTDGIRQLLEDSDLCASLVKKGLERAHSRSWDHVAAETIEVYERAAA